LPRLAARGLAFEARIPEPVIAELARRDHEIQLASDDPQICAATVAKNSDAEGGIATSAAVGIGQTRVNGADLAITVTVV